MKFSIKVRYSLFGFLIFLSFILRYPFIPHEVGSDSFQIHAYANSISSFGHATWIIHPYSYIGLTPDSYPSAVPFLLSAMSQCMNIDMEYSILLLTFIVGLLGLFGSILLAKQIKDDDLFIFLVAFIFSTSPVFLRFTIWTTATRHIFMALFPFFLWSLLKLKDYVEINWKFIVLIIIIFIMLLSTHRMGLLSFIIILAFINTMIIFKYFNKLHFNLLIQRCALAFWFLILLSFILLQIWNMGIYKDINISHNYQSGQFFNGNKPWIIFMNMTIDYVSRIGILSIFGIIGFGAIFFKKGKPNFHTLGRRNFSEIFILLALLFSSSIFLLGLYLSLFLLLILILLICFGILWSINLLNRIKWNFISKNKKMISIIFVTCLLMISLFFSAFMIQHWLKPSPVTEETKWIDDDTIDIAFYLNNYQNDHNFQTNTGFLHRKLAAWERTPLNYRIDLERISIEKGGLIDLITKDTLYVEKGKKTDEDYIYLPPNGLDDPKTIDYLNTHDLKFIIEEKSIYGKKTVGMTNLEDSRFLESMHEECYKIYEIESFIIWST